MKIGIFFGGPAREREVSYAGGRTALANLDKGLFEPVLVFVDGRGRFRLVTPDFLQAPSLRDVLPQGDSGFSVYDESLPIDLLDAALPELRPEQFRDHFDLAFLAMHGPDCEDGAIQGLLEWHKMPYTGPGLLGSAVGINKILQNELIALANGQQKKTATISRDAYERTDKAEFFQSLQAHLGLPIVIKAPHQGSSIGVVIVREADLTAFCRGVEQCFFTMSIQPDGWSQLSQWGSLSATQKHELAQKMVSLDSGISFPIVIEQTGELIRHPHEFVQKLDALSGSGSITLASVNAEDEVLFEEFISGQEFSCGVIQDDDQTAIALPPTEIYNTTAFDFETKYKSNVAKKRIPVETSLENNRKIQLAVSDVFKRLGINVYSRIDGFLTPAGDVLLHDPNTIPGMSPSSLIFKQMAEIGLNLSNSLTYLIRQSLRERIRTGKNTYELKQLLAQLDGQLAHRKANPLPERVVSFGPTDEQFIAAKQQYNELAASGTVRPSLMYIKNKTESHEIPVYLLFRDTIEELETALSQPRHPLLIETTEQTKHITDRYL
ncbi:D-alanine--D-alanine ligase family protein [Spirosoma utsteinense]|uniref:D-alanine--D-alanine ligase n=1 Tax=Spirosoma utsteinense TaxID=2585773 RepID=A0ABR6W8X5_9BACT|nr:D-alanine--D-alanine ligase [Spirosoma utsteinense]MBC3787688.1 D-alanine-D-alanine ligase [Spirosoma utsteinense]MBC3792709.1 D-alanine-D-alanine ligase [Spirosoma utsteinense]